MEWIDEVKPGRKTVAGGRSQTEWWKRAIALEKSKDLHGLLELFLKWTQDETSNEKAWYNLGVVYGDLKRYNDAIEALRQAVRINPEYAKAWNILGGLYAFSGNRTGALEVVQKLRTLDPEKADRLFDFIRRLDGQGKK